MVAPPLHDVLLYRRFHGRREQWLVQESEYDKLQGAFGRMPVVTQLGYFLQLKPTGSSVSLIADPREFEDKDAEYPVEPQQATELFCKTPLSFELQASNRFADGGLCDLVNFMRAPARTVPPAIARA